MKMHQRIASMFLNRVILGSEAEKEVERFLRALLPGSPFEGKIKATGGYVRDEYLSLLKNDPSIEAKDLDLLVEMKDGAEKATKYIYDTFTTRWDKVKEFFTGTSKNPVSRPRQLGKGYPIWQITFKDNIKYKGKTYKTKGAVIEFADTMKESYPDSESRQRKTEPAGLKEDIERRDFTVNMLLKDMTTGEVEDLTGTSKNDIARGILKGHPQVSLDTTFKNDPLRMLRLIRFKTKYDWDIPLHVLRAVKRNADRIKIISSERITEELKKIMKYGKLADAIKFMSSTGLLKYVLPEVEVLKGVKQGPEHHAEGDVYKHTLLVLKNTAPGVESQMAALLHDIGKPGEAEDLGDKISFHGHEESGAEIAEAIMKRLKFDNATAEKVKKMVRNHMRPHNLGKSPTSKALRKFVREVGDEVVDSVLDLARADELGSLPSTNNIPDLRKKIDEIRKEKPPEKKKPVLDGKEIMDLLNVKEGPEVGKAMKILNDLADEYGPDLTKGKAKEELKKRFKKSASAMKVVSSFLSRDGEYVREGMKLYWVSPSGKKWAIGVFAPNESGHGQWGTKESTKGPGEKIISGDGYYMIKTPKGYKGKTYIGGRYVYEHRYIMEKKLERPLKYNENIDHINGNKLDNRPSNLRLMSRAKHTEMNKPADKPGIGKGK